MNTTRILRYKTWQDNSGPYFRWQVEQFAPYLGDRIADLGCGPGTLTPFLADRELYVAVDSDPAMLAHVELQREHFPNLLTIAADITSDRCRYELRRARVDTIVTANTIEHIENDRLAMQVMSDAVPPGGHICVLVPAFQMLYGTLDSLDGHYRRYTIASLRTCIAGLPLEPRRMYYFNSIGALGWWLKGRLLRRSSQAASDYRMMSLMVPVLRPLEKAIKPPVGLSLIAILKRMAGPS